MNDFDEIRVRELLDELMALRAEIKTLNSALQQSENEKLKQKCAEIEKLKQRCAELEKLHEEDLLKISNMEEEINYYRSKLFGPSRERLECPGQLSFLDSFNEAETAEQSAEISEESQKEEQTAEQAPTAKKKAPRKNRITNQEKFKNLPEEKIVHRLSETERVCDICGGPLTPIGEEYMYTKVKYIPAQLIVEKHYREKYRCDQCEQETGNSHIQAANLPEPIIPHSFASPSLIVQSIYEKFINSVPYYRQEKGWGQFGLQISRADMASWQIFVSVEYFKPIYELIHRELLKRMFLMADETRVQVLHEAGRAATSTSYMWLYRSGEDELPPLVLYQYTETRSQIHPQEFLKGYQGYLMTDGYQGYNDLPGVKRYCCWAHVRRYFYEAVPKEQQANANYPAVQAVKYCDTLFDYERQAKQENFSAEQRKQLRLDKEKPVLTAFWSWLDKQNPDPGSKFGKAVKYARNLKPRLETYLEDGRCSLSNNLSENAIRPFTIGRKNWLFSDTPKGAESSAILYTMVEMAKNYGLNVRAYLEYVLTRRPNTKWSDEKLTELLPNNEEVKKACAIDREN